MSEVQLSLGLRRLLTVTGGLFDAIVLLSNQSDGLQIDFELPHSWLIISVIESGMHPSDLVYLE